MSGKKIFVLMISILVLTSCNVGDPFSAEEAITTLILQFNNLPALENDYHYEGWAVVDDEDKSIGKFKINESGVLTDIQGGPVLENTIGTEFDVSQATLIKISVEEAGDVNSIPSGSYILAGPVSGFSAVLSVSHAEAMGVSFSSATAKYLLATPSTTDTLDEKSGIWFQDEIVAEEPVPGIIAFDLESDWEYECWITVDGIELSTGKFDLPGAGDNSIEYLGDGSIPFLPGEDFINNAPAGLTFPLDLSGASIKITLESEKDDDRHAPSLLILFTGQVPFDAVINVNYTLTNQSSTLPSGTIALVQDEEGK
ncbi:MAG: anti-sigma factor [bacterium]|nr:anti-sigma factor [bacterium]